MFLVRSNLLSVLVPTNKRTLIINCRETWVYVDSSLVRIQIWAAEWILFGADVRNIDCIREVDLAKINWAVTGHKHIQHTVIMNPNLMYVMWKTEPCCVTAPEGALASERWQSMIFKCNCSLCIMHFRLCILIRCFLNVCTLFEHSSLYLDDPYHSAVLLPPGPTRWCSEVHQWPASHAPLDENRYIRAWLPGDLPIPTLSSKYDHFWHQKTKMATTLRPNFMFQT